MAETERSSGFFSGVDMMPIASAYIVLPSKEDFDNDAVRDANSHVEHDQPLGSRVSQNWEHIPDARGLRR